MWCWCSVYEQEVTATAADGESEASEVVSDRVSEGVNE